MKTPPSSEFKPKPLAFTLSLSLTPIASRIIVTAVAAALTFLLWILLSTPLISIEERLGSLGWVLAPSTVTEERITIVAIDEKSLAQVGPWPWPRETLAELSLALTAAGASLQLFDIVLPETKAGDDRLVEALGKTNSVLAQVPLLQSDQILQTGVMSHHLASLRCQPPIPVAHHYLASNKNFVSIPKGHITPTVEKDGMIRTMPPLICIEGKVYPALAISALVNAIDTQEDLGAFIQAEKNLLAADTTLKFSAYPGVSIPIDNKGQMRISYKYSPQSYQAVSAADVLNGSAAREVLNGAWVIIGATAFGLGDIVPTPHSGATPGVELQARILASLLDNDIPFTPRLSGLLLLSLSLVYSLILLRLASLQGRTSTYGLPLAGMLLPLFALGLHLQLLTANIWIGWLPPALFAIIAATLLSVLEHGRVRMERSRIYNNLNSYLPANTAAEIAFNLPSSAIDAQRRELTLLCADLRNFSAFEESCPPEESAALLHCFFVKATYIIEQHKGNVHEFKGDSLLATWAADSNNDATVNALSAAKELQKMIHDILPTSPRSGLAPLALGVSIEQGPTLVGSIGPAHRRTHTLLGDTVTITLRIQEMTQELAQPILIGEYAARHLNKLEIQSQGAYLLNGLRKPHTLFAPMFNDTASNHIDIKQAHKFKVHSGGRK